MTALTLTPDMTERLGQAGMRGAYESVGDAMRQALLDWEEAEAHRERLRAELRDAVGVGLADVDAGRVKPFDADAIIAEGRELSARRSNSG